MPFTDKSQSMNPNDLSWDEWAALDEEEAPEPAEPDTPYDETPAYSTRSHGGNATFQVPVERRTPNPSYLQEQAQQRARIEQRLEDVETLTSLGYSQRAIAKAVGVSRAQVQLDLDTLRKRRVLEGAPTLTDRLDLTLLKRRRLFQQMQEVLTRKGKGALDKDKVAAAEVALKILDSIDDLEGTRAPDKVNVQALAEVYEVFAGIVAQALPEQQGVFQRLIMERLRGTQMGALLLGSGSIHGQLYVEESPEEGSDEPITDQIPVEDSELDVDLPEVPDDL